jgi:cyanate permease
MGITSLLILFVIIYQAYILLTNPDDESKLSSVGKSLGYIFAGIVVIGLGYVITNVFLIQ